MSPKRGFIKWSGFFLLALAIISLIVFSIYFLFTKDRLDGEIRLAGLAGPVSIKFDTLDIPHVSANTDQDALLALGFLHATQRPWQMEFNRRLASGKLAEVLGPDALPVDRFIRTLGIRRAAEKQLENYPVEAKKLLQAYADGVNQGYKHLGWALPPEFLLTGAKPGLWAPADSLAWSIMMALDLGGNWDKEFLRLELSKHLETNQIWDVIPPYLGDTPPTGQNFAKIYRDLGLYKKSEEPTKTSQRLKEHQQLSHFLPIGQEGKGSNNWVVAPEKSATGKPWLANDPHLTLTAPAIWYFARIQSPQLNIMGGTIPGMPTVVLGRTADFAWGFTNTDPDVQDLFIEAVDPSNPGRYQTPNGFAHFQLREETINIKGQAAEKFIVRETRHGPVISDAYPRAQALLNTKQFVLALRWSALDTANQTLLAGLKMNRAQNLEEFKASLKHYYAPMQNVVMADQSGEIALRVAGVGTKRTRHQGFAGATPGLGWDRQYEWPSYLSSDVLPKESKPSRAWIATANQRVQAANDPNPLTFDWHMPFRQERIESLLQSKESHDLASMKAIQSDVHSLLARDLLPIFQNISSQHSLASAVQSHVQSFDGTMSTDSVGASIFNAWAHQLTVRLLAHRLQETFKHEYGKRDFRPALHRILQYHLQGKAEAQFWCDLVTTSQEETCDDAIRQAYDLALDQLSQQLGKNTNEWRWGKVHIAHSEHRPFSKISFLKKRFEVASSMPGDGFTINVGFMDHSAQNPFQVTKAPSLRVIYNLADLDQSQFIYQTGQSGWVHRNQYRDFSDAWSKQEYRPLSMNPERWARQAELKPMENTKPAEDGPKKITEQQILRK